jgi:hypothetical protein
MLTLARLPTQTASLAASSEHAQTSWLECYGLITNNDETAYREEVRALREWWQENNLSLDVSKTKELIVDFRKQQRKHGPIHIDRTAMEKVESLSGGKFPGLHITDDLKWSTHTDSVVKKAQQCLFNLRRLKKFGLAPKTLKLLQMHK